MSRYGRPHPGPGKVIVLMQLSDGRTRAIAGYAEEVLIEHDYEYGPGAFDPLPPPFFTRTHRSRLEVRFSPNVQMVWREPGDWRWEDVPGDDEEIEGRRELPAAPPRALPPAAPKEIES